MKLSARNVLKAKVVQVVKGAVNSEVTLELPGGGTDVDAKAQVPEEDGGYPDVTMFKIPMPSSVLFLRHVRGVSVRNLRVKFQTEDARPLVVTDDVEGMDCDL